jgi:hypothetical protein
MGGVKCENRKVTGSSCANAMAGAMAEIASASALAPIAFLIEYSPPD